MALCFKRTAPMSFDEFFAFIQSLDGQSASTLRISVRLVSNFVDVYRFIRFLRGFLDKLAAEINALDIPTLDERMVRDTA